MSPVILRANPSPDDDAWVFHATLPPRKRPDMGLHVSFTAEAIKLDWNLYPSNRILHSDDKSKFLLVSFESLRFPDKPASTTRDYKIRMFKAGFHLNGVEYRFYGHSNSQLRSGSCFMRVGTDVELERRINSYGEFSKIKNVAKCAKRIGLLFSKAEIDWTLDPKYTQDIEDIIVNGENFSDGCGLIAPHFARMLSRRKRIVFHGRPYTPSVFQIRYKGYKGVLMQHRELSKECVAQFRASQRKFKATNDNTFSVVAHSVPYAYARLNNEIVVLLSSLGITHETFLRRQEEYHGWIRTASADWQVAFNVLCALKQFEAAERLLLRGIEHRDVQASIRSAQMAEIGAFKKKEKFRARMIIPKSRFLFGICDPYGVLKEGEVHVRVSVPRKGATTLTNTQVLVVRNPCLHPGDCLKLRAVEHPRLSHLVDCIVFASTGERAAPSMSAGGDLDGDEYTVIWDPDFVPRKVAESYTYPPGKEHVVSNVTREDLARHFASYNSMALARIVNLHSKWVRCSPKGAMSDECQDLNALHSLVVDGGSVKIPDRLTRPPEDPTDPFILDLLRESAKAFYDEFIQTVAASEQVIDTIDAEEVLVGLLTSEKLAISEFELITMAARFADSHHLDIREHLGHVDFSALTTAEKYAISYKLGLTPEKDPYVWNSLIRSEILQPRDLEDRKLGGPLRLQRLYTSSQQGRAAFFEYLRLAVANFTRRMLILRTDDRFSVGVFLRGEIAWDDDAEVNQNVVVCSFMPKASGLMSTYWQGTRGYQLYCGDSVMQLFDKQRANSFIFVTRPPPRSGVDIVTSIALNKISQRVQQQCGRVLRNPVLDIEIHVVSCRDRIAHQAFDLRFEHVQTEETLKRFDHAKTSFHYNTIDDYEWGDDNLGAQLFDPDAPQDRAQRTFSRLDESRLRHYFDIAIQYRVERHVFMIFNILLEKGDFAPQDLSGYVDAYPSLVYCILKKHIPEGPAALPESFSPLAPIIVRNIIRSADAMGIAVLAALERLVHDINALDLGTYIDILWLTTLCIRSPKLVQEVLLVLHDCRADARSSNPIVEYAHKHALGVAFDRAEDAADTCPCDETGRPKRQSSRPTRAKLVVPPPPKEAATTPGGAKTSGTLGEGAQAEGAEPVAEEPEAEESDETIVVAHTRIDAPNSVRIHNHVRLQVASVDPAATRPPPIVDALVTRATRGEMYLTVQQPLPPEWQAVDWNIFDAGGTATSAAMLDAVRKLALKRYEACRLYNVIVGLPLAHADASNASTEADVDEGDQVAELDSQRAVVLATQSPLCLIWGPPGTGKTTVVVEILGQLIRRFPDAKILMTASTHNAVDNVLERFVKYNHERHLLEDDQILRAATESSRVKKELQKYTVDSRLGGNINDNPRLLQKAVKRVKASRIVFTTCSGAGLGILRSVDFDTVLIDEASQITEPCALIPLVKGCKRAVLVGDHVQLRPTVKPMGKALEFDRSLFERLWRGTDYPELARTMLEVQYRFSEDVALFPSHEFYEGRLQTGTSRATEIASTLGISSFPWPTVDGRIRPVVFAPCSSDEDHGRQSKSNAGQVALVKYIVSLMRKPLEESEEHTSRLRSASIVVLTPYSRQVKLLKETLPASMNVEVSTIDGFQGREGDIVIFSTVRCNMEGDIGFVEDERRLNVAWTRPTLGLVIVGDRRTLQTTSSLWQRALASCHEVVIARPEESA
ncbi:RNA dependent RNA polymerase-domain-containing protein [Cubamyces lactineus]|nr:RNA dependent RNA polymerase-domain-containing protein [Cubamyces lactineus]